MDMAQKNSNDGLALLFMAVGAAVLYYLYSGKGEENDAPLIPNDLEGRIDLVVAALNRQLGKRWVDFGLHAIRSHLQKVLPPPVVALVNVIYNVEQFARFTEMSGYQKRRTAVVWATS
jgi:hypothetical protein